MRVRQELLAVQVGLCVLAISSLWAHEIHDAAQSGDVKRIKALPDNPSETKPPIQYDVLERRPIYTGSLPTGTGVRMDVLVSATTTKADALALGKYFRERHGNDIIDIEIWDSRDVWAKKPLWNQYADAGNAQMVHAIEKEFAKHFLVKVFYNPQIKAASPDIAQTLDRIQWIAEDRDQSPRASAVELNLDFVAGTVNGHKWDSLNVESVTDLLGRPDTIRAPKKDASRVKWGACLSYGTKGIRFNFEHPQSNPTQIVDEIQIFLVPSIAKDYADNTPQTFSAFGSPLNKGVDADWKIQRFLQEFEADGAVDKADLADIAKRRAEYELELKKMSDVAAKSGGEYSDVYERLKKRWQKSIDDLRDECYAEIKVGHWSAKVYYDPTTKFLNRIVVSRPIRPL